MINRKRQLGLWLGACLFGWLAPQAFGAEVAYTAAAFNAAVAARQPVAVVFHADWCPTCRAQAPVLKELAESAELKAVTLFVADFDTEKGLRQTLKVARQSTVVVFRNGQEVLRSTGQTSRSDLAALLHTALASGT